MSVDRARRLRALETDAERKLWFWLRDRRMRGLEFRRQHPIGPFTADFCSPEARLVIEVDGGRHAMEVESDRRRTELLERQGYRVVRFGDNEVLRETEAVLERVHQALGDPHPGPLPGRERERRA